MISVNNNISVNSIINVNNTVNNTNSAVMINKYYSLDFSSYYYLSELCVKIKFAKITFF